MELPDGFELAAVLPREDPRDAWVSNRFARVDELPQGACVGTSSLRRVVQLLARRPDLRIEPLRGNLDTRLRKLDEGGYDAIVLAAAGLKRLGLAERIRSVFEVDEMLPAAGQGALGIEIRSHDAALASAIAVLVGPARLARHTRGTRGFARIGGAVAVCLWPRTRFGQAKFCTCAQRWAAPPHRAAACYTLMCAPKFNLCTRPSNWAPERWRL